MSAVNGLIAKVLYGTGMRLMEVIRLRVQDIDFDRNEVIVRSEKSAKDRITMLPVAIKPALEQYLAPRRSLFNDYAAKKPAICLFCQRH